MISLFKSDETNPEACSHEWELVDRNEDAKTEGPTIHPEEGILVWTVYDTVMLDCTECSYRIRDVTDVESADVVIVEAKDVPTDFHTTGERFQIDRFVSGAGDEIPDSDVHIPK